MRTDSVCLLNHLTPRDLNAFSGSAAVPSSSKAVVKPWNASVVCFSTRQNIHLPRSFMTQMGRSRNSVHRNQHAKPSAKKGKKAIYYFIAKKLSLYFLRSAKRAILLERSLPGQRHRCKAFRFYRQFVSESDSEESE